jgi:uncharacterized protein
LVATKRRSSGPRPRRVPQRTCVACRSVEGKRGLVRVVRTPEGSIQVDPTGKKNGRGAYLHASRTCWDTALKRKTLQHALKAEISEADRAALAAYRDSLPAEAPADETATRASIEESADMATDEGKVRDA